MSPDGVTPKLKKLNKVDILSLDARDISNHFSRESDRSAIILWGSSVDALLAFRLEKLFKGMNKEERRRILDYRGTCGSFADRIQMAHALGILNREGRKRASVLKEMRNAAAHSFARITFETTAIKEAVACLYPPKYRTEIASWPPLRIRAAFHTLMVRYCDGLHRDRDVNFEESFAKSRDGRLKPHAWPDPHTEASPETQD